MRITLALCFIASYDRWRIRSRVRRDSVLEKRFTQTRTVYAINDVYFTMIFNRNGRVESTIGKRFKPNQLNEIERNEQRK